MTVGLMAKPKARKSESPKPAKTIGFRVSGAYAEWIEEFASSERMSVATLIDRAVASYAKDNSFREPPERSL
jgi:hypothetical protein